jgi:hypothetical protein
MRRSHGEIVNIMSRAGQHLMGWVVDKFGWEAKVAADSQTLRELQFLKQFLKEFNGQPIWGAGVESQVVQAAEAEKLVQAVGKEFELVHQGRPAYTLRVDGSMQVVCRCVM